jgi:hypothetical protein
VHQILAEDADAPAPPAVSPYLIEEEEATVSR